MKKICIILILFLFTSCISTKYTFYYENKIELIENKGMHFMKTSINGKFYYLLIDTGASKSLLDITQSKEVGFGYTLLSKDKYVGIGGVTDIYVIYNYKSDDMYITFLGCDLSEVISYFEKDGMHIIGVLGSDFFERYEAKIDFTTNILYY
jgi:hypothetical protein